MAKELHDCEFWLPPQFITDDDEGKKCSGFDFQLNFSNGLGRFSNYSGLSSPVESVVDSVETESDEDDYVTELSRKMAQSTLDDEASKTWDLSGSPNSPLCRYGPGLSSFRSVPQVSSTYGSNQKEGAWNLLCAAAGEVSRMKMVEESSAGFYPSRNGPVVLPTKPGSISVPAGNNGPNFACSSNQPHLSYQQFQAALFERMEREKMVKQQLIIDVYSQGNGGCGWPTLQQAQQQRKQPVVPPLVQVQPQRGSGMRAVFLGNSGAKRECAGTGVFLPRRGGSSTESRKNKPGCSTVLLPERVVHALNLNLERMDTQLHSRYNPSFAPDYDGGMKYNNKNLVRPQHSQTSMRPQPAMTMMMTNNQELRLPQDWTY